MLYEVITSQIAEYLEVSTDYLLGNESNIKVYDEHDNIVVLDDETREIIDSLRTNPEMKILFSVTKKATKEDIIQARITSYNVCYTKLLRGPRGDCTTPLNPLARCEARASALDLININPMHSGVL